MDKPTRDPTQRAGLSAWLRTLVNGQDETDASATPREPARKLTPIEDILANTGRRTEDQT